MFRLKVVGNRPTETYGAIAQSYFGIWPAISKTVSYRSVQLTISKLRGFHTISNMFKTIYSDIFLIIFI